MGADIHAYAQVFTPALGWTEVKDLDEPFGERNYDVFGFLANVRNYAHSPVISEPRGLPEGAWGDDHSDFHSHSWLSLAELLDYDYDRVFWNRRVHKEISPGFWDGAALAQEGEGEHLSLRAFLGKRFFAHLERLKTLGEPENVRVVFWFDS